MSIIDDITSRITALEGMFPALAPATTAAADTDDSGSAGSSTSTTADGTAPLVAFDSQLQSAMAAEADPADSTGAVEVPQGPTTSATSATGTSTSTAAIATSGVTGSEVATDAEKYLGVPYVYGGTNPATGLDCSALVQRTYADLGITLPRTSQEQSTMGTAVSSLAQAQPGDLLGFDGTPPTHTGIYIGNNQMVVAPHTGEKVQIQTLTTTPTTIRRILGTSADPTAATGMSAAALTARPAALGGIGSAASAAITNPGGAATYAAQFSAAEQKYNLPTGLLSAVAHAESDYQPGAVSSAGAIGLMQLMPATASALGVDPTDPSQAIDGAAKLLQGEIAKYNSVPLALAAYNAGGPAVDKYGGIPPYPQTQSYVQTVMGYLNGDA